jgi:hypothetical protein
MRPTGLMFRNWFRNLRSFLVDLCVDGFAAVSFAAPAASLSFTLAKAFDVPMAGLHQLSYAWAFLPLTIWFFVAYVRRRAAKSRERKLAKLQEFYVRAAPFHSTAVRPENLQQFISEIESWANEAANWIDGNLGRAARERFVDRTGHSPLVYNGLSKEHSDALVSVRDWRNNLTRLIESDAWDAKS